MTDFFTRLAERTLGSARLVRPVSPRLTSDKEMRWGGSVGESVNGEGSSGIDHPAPTPAESVRSSTRNDCDQPRIILPQRESLRSSKGVTLPAETARDLTNAGEGKFSEAVLRQKQENDPSREGEGRGTPVHSDLFRPVKSSSPSPGIPDRPNGLPSRSREIPQSADSIGDRYDKTGRKAPNEHVRDGHRSKLSGEGDLPVQHYEKSPIYRTGPFKISTSRNDALHDDETGKSFAIRNRFDDAVSANLGGVIRAAVPASTAGMVDRSGRHHPEQRPDEQRQTIKITIGRIDVRAVTQLPAPMIKQAKPEKPRLSLSEYLMRRSGGSK